MKPRPLLRGFAIRPLRYLHIRILYGAEGLVARLLGRYYNVVDSVHPGSYLANKVTYRRAVRCAAFWNQTEAAWDHNRWRIERWTGGPAS